MFFHNLVLHSVLLSSEQSLSFNFCIDLRFPLSLFTLHEQIGGGAK